MSAVLGFAAAFGVFVILGTRMAIATQDRIESSFPSPPQDPA